MALRPVPPKSGTRPTAKPTANTSAKTFHIEKWGLMSALRILQREGGERDVR